MATGTVSPSAAFEWIIPRSIVHSFRSGGWIISPDFHLPDSSWYLQLYISKLKFIAIYLHRRDTGESKNITFTIKVYVRTKVKEFTQTVDFDTINSHSGELMDFRMDEVSVSDLLIICNIKCNTLRPEPGKKFETSAVQAEDEDWPSLDRKDDTLLRERMKEFLAKGHDHDVTICVQDKEFRAHRSILSARSPVFAMMFAHDTKEKNTGTISIEDCDPESFDEFLLYVYSGRTENLTPSNALRLYYPADKYDFPVLKERCVTLLKISMSIESICDVVLLAAKHQEKELLDVAAKFLARNMKTIFVTAGWQKFMSQNPVESNELLIKSTEFLQPEN